MKMDVYNLSFAEWESQFKAWGESSFRAKQLWKWLYESWVSEWGQMLNLSQKLRDRLAESYSLEGCKQKMVSGALGGAQKLLLELADGEQIETVVIPAYDRRTVCVSSQAGCAFKCAFCASGVTGLVRRLECGEIVGQVVAACRVMERRPSNVVVMGIGEPFDNYDVVLKALRILNFQPGMCIGARRITISSCGVVPGIAKLAAEKEQFELSISLHAPTDVLRSELMPVNKKWPLEELMAACRAYTETCGRIITYEYTLIKGVNDRVCDLKALIHLLRKHRCKVNLIPLSPVDEFEGETPSKEACERFWSSLNEVGIVTTLRMSKGTDVDAACGQLRLKQRNRE